MKRFIFPVVIVFIFLAAFNVTDAQAKEGEMALSGGLGLTFPMGDTGDLVDFPMIPLLLSFQYAILPYLTLEADISYFLYTSPAEDYIDEFNMYQFGVSARYWFTEDWKEGKVLKGIYLGGGLARTNVEVKMDLPIVGSVSADDDYSTLVLKGGYLYPLESVTLDIGGRYDAVDFEFGDALLTAYCMAIYKFD